ncbi:hypothetical protein M0R04_06985 [Candidatus Dojkabacteria bacterium]|jgi:hypothetical protein|nr:hypothetical protein [Candidatus Dojkabacteria bacterium]
MTIEDALTWLIDARKLSSHKDKIAELKVQTQFLPQSAVLSQRLWHVINDTQQMPLCKICQSPVSWDQAHKQYKIYCGNRKCPGMDHIVNLKKKQHSNYEKQKERRIQTNLERYGVENSFQVKEFQEKQKQTNLNRYGYEFTTLVPKVIEKKNNTWYTKYGVSHPWKADTLRIKIKQTMNERYGVDFAMQSEHIQEKTKQTNLKRFGGHPQQNKQVRDSTMLTCLWKYGVDNPRKSALIKEKIKKTCLENFGVDNPNYIKNSHIINLLPQLTDYHWLFDQYINQGKTAEGLAVELGLGTTTVLNYLHKHEITIKYNYSYSYACIGWLESIIEKENLHIQHALNGGEYSIPRTPCHADGFCRETNTIYEFYGDYWHGNPKVYEPEFINQINSKTMGELYTATIIRENKIKELGYNLITVWESDFNNMNNPPAKARGFRSNDRNFDISTILPIRYMFGYHKA